MTASQPDTKLSGAELDALAVACSSPSLPPEQAMWTYEEQVQRLSFAVERILATRLAAHRREWVDYFESWSGAVGPEPLTVELVIRALRRESLPFGRAAQSSPDTEDGA